MYPAAVSIFPLCCPVRIVHPLHEVLGTAVCNVKPVLLSYVCSFVIGHVEAGAYNHAILVSSTSSYSNIQGSTLHVNSASCEADVSACIF